MRTLFNNCWALSNRMPFNSLFNYLGTWSTNCNYISVSYTQKWSSTSLALFTLSWCRFVMGMSFCISLAWHFKNGFVDDYWSGLLNVKLRNVKLSNLTIIFNSGVVVLITLYLSFKLKFWNRNAHWVTLKIEQCEQYYKKNTTLLTQLLRKLRLNKWFYTNFCLNKNWTESGINSVLARK